MEHKNLLSFWYFKYSAPYLTLSGVSHEWAFQKAKHLHFKKRNWVSLKKREDSN
jgi:hypothetical protein